MCVFFLQVINSAFFNRVYYCQLCTQIEVEAMAKQKTRKKQLTKQEYDKLKHSFYELVVIQGHSQKEACEMLDISTVTGSKWAKDGDFKKLRQDRQQDYRTDVDNIRQLIRLKAKRKLTIEEEILDAQTTGDTEEEERLRKESLGIADELSKLTKTLQGIEKDQKYTLGEFINVMDDIFTSLREYDLDLFNKTIQFQGYIVRKKSNELG